MGEISVLRIVEGVLIIVLATASLKCFDQTRRYIKEKARPKPGGRRSIDRYWLRLAVGILLHPDRMPHARSGESFRQTLTLVWDAYVWRRRLAFVVPSALSAIYTVVRII